MIKNFLLNKWYTFFSIFVSSFYLAICVFSFKLHAYVASIFMLVCSVFVFTLTIFVLRK